MNCWASVRVCRDRYLHIRSRFKVACEMARAMNKCRLIPTPQDLKAAFLSHLFLSKQHQHRVEYIKKKLTDIFTICNDFTSTNERQ